MTSIAVGLASGLGNAVFMLPTIKELKAKDDRVSLFVQTDFPTADLFKRCIYADEVLEPPAGLNGHHAVCGQWRPAAWRGIGNVLQYQTAYPYRIPEWQSNLRLVGQSERVDVSDWCRDLDRTPRWDVGIVPGSKGGVWMRKRWPGMAKIAENFITQGKRVAVFGLEQDGVADIPGEYITSEVSSLPDMLSGCRVVVGTDSGVTHLASSLGIPVVVVYTATSEIKGDPVGRSVKIKPQITCYPCQSTARWQACSDWQCRNIDPSLIIQATENLMRDRVDA